MSEDSPHLHPETPHQIPMLAVALVYGGMAILSYVLGFSLADRNVLVWEHPDLLDTTLPIDVALGAGAGLLVVLASRLMDWAFAWARTLGDNLKRLLGELDGTRILVLAVASSIGEEMLFRGLLQPALGLHLSSLIFGLLHKGPDKTYLPWTIMAVGMGYAFGLMFFYTGSLLAPILAHFTINYFNLHALARREVGPTTHAL